MENARQKIFNFQMSKLDTKIINKNLVEVLNKLDSAAKTNSVFHNVEMGK